jgi:hypothetical protein
MKKVLTMIGLVVLLAACTQQSPLANPEVEGLEAQANTWQPLGGALDVVTKNNAVKPKLLLDRNGKPVVVWAEDNGLWYLQAKRWNGTAWEKLPLPTKALRYTDAGVNDFDVAFDSTNALVVSQVIAEVSLEYFAPVRKIEVYRSAGSSWTKLGAFNGQVQLESDSSGGVHAVFFSPTTGNNFIKRGNGTAWQMVARLRQIVTHFSPGSSYHTPAVVTTFALKSDGKPFVTYNWKYAGSNTEANIEVVEWDGASWRWVDEWVGAKEQLIVDKGNKSILSYTNYFPVVVRQNGKQLGEKVGDAYIFATTVDRLNRTVVSLVESGAGGADLFVKRWTGSAWVTLGKALDRDISKVSTNNQVITDSNGNLFVVWQEATCVDSASCGGANIHVSKYVQ